MAIHRVDEIIQEGFVALENLRDVLIEHWDASEAGAVHYDCKACEINGILVELKDEAEGLALKEGKR